MARNRGLGDARDVALIAVDADGRQLGWRSAHADVLTFGEELELWITFEDPEPGRPRGEVILISASGGQRHAEAVESPSSRTVWIQLTYHRAPNLSRTHKLRRSHTDPLLPGAK